MSKWNGAELDKETHPIMGRFVDNIYVLFANRVAAPLFSAAVLALVGFIYTRIELINEVSRDTVRLTMVVDKLVDKIDAQGNILAAHTTQIDAIPKILENQAKTQEKLKEETQSTKDWHAKMEQSLGAIVDRLNRDEQRKLGLPP